MPQTQCVAFQEHLPVKYSRTTEIMRLLSVFVPGYNIRNIAHVNPSMIHLLLLKLAGYERRGTDPRFSDDGITIDACSTLLSSAMTSRTLMVSS